MCSFVSPVITLTRMVHCKTKLRSQSCLSQSCLSQSCSSRDTQAPGACPVFFMPCPVTQSLPQLSVSSWGESFSGEKPDGFICKHCTRVFCVFSPYTGNLLCHSTEWAAEDANPATKLWRWAARHRTELRLGCQPQDYVAWTVTGEISPDLLLPPGDSEIALHGPAEPLLGDGPAAFLSQRWMGTPKCTFVPAPTWYLIMESDLWEYLIMRNSHFWGREWPILICVLTG